MRWALAFSLLVAGCEQHSTLLPPERPVVVASPPPTPKDAPSAIPKAAEPRSPAGLTARLAEYDRLVATNAAPALIAEAREAVDHMAGQRDAHMARLYWYTDLDEAKAEAKRTGKPILSLRMLGRLDEDLSCTNSRLFRIVLYANENVSKFMRDSYVLHWSSERPVPQITLDFGDGRVVKRTVTGNSIHYVLDAQGRVVDALPGLYGPVQFEKRLRESLELAKQSDDLSDDDANKAIAKYHLHNVWALTATWRNHLKRAYESYGPEYAEKATLPSPTKFDSDPLYDSIPAAAVNELTVSKADTEAPTMALLQPTVSVSADFGAWSKVAARAPAEHLDAHSRALLLSKHPRDWSSSTAPELGEAELGKRVARFEARLTEEAFRNEFMFHGALHQRMSKPAKLDFASVNEFVYARLFMTPKNDPWIGLRPTEALTGMDEDGIVTSASLHVQVPVRPM